ncbi:MAG: NAD(P) transhydrogenase subunit alpha [Actinomycetota bacterium]|nr:NAD(P) transhydrogenase subunit alpha [Actinomycetota bacterium]
MALTSVETNGAARPLVVGVVREDAADEARVAVVPDGVGKLAAAGCEVVVERGAGSGAYFPDDAYERAGARLVGRDELVAVADVVLFVGAPGPSTVGALRSGQVVVGMLRPLVDPALSEELAARGVTAYSLDGLPRTLSRAQPMDALSSQASIAGYKAAIVAAHEHGRYFPMLITAAGTSRPTEVLVLGAGVAGLQAIGTAKRLGAVVRGYDVRPEAREQILSLGARYLELKSVAAGEGEGGYARSLTAEEQQAQQEELNSHIAAHDVVITTAQVPGRRPPLLVTAAAVAAMRPGSVIVDMAASELGGNVELSRPGERVVTDGGVTILGAGNLASTMAAGASAAYSHNISALLLHLVRDGAVVVDPEEEIQAGVLVAHGGAVVHRATAALLDGATAGGAANKEDAR